MERVPQDARGAAAAHDLRARHDRGAEGAADRRRPLPPLRLRPADDRADRRGAPARRRAGADLGARRGARADRPQATGSFRDALGTLEQLVAYSRHDDHARRTCSPCSAPPTPTCCSARWTPSAPATPRTRCAPPPGSPSPAATSAASSRDLEAHLRGLMIVQTLGGEVPAELHLTAEADERLVDQARRTPPGDRHPSARPAGRRPAGDEGRRRRPHAARARARQGRRPRPRREPEGAAGPPRAPRARPAAARRRPQTPCARPSSPPPRPARPAPSSAAPSRRAGRAARSPPSPSRPSRSPRPRQPAVAVAVAPVDGVDRAARAVAGGAQAARGRPRRACSAAPSRSRSTTTA